jgi:hypothetical protein
MNPTASSKLPPSSPLHRPVFIVGPGRSGTTLLRSLLATHPRLAVTPETHFLHLAARASGRPRHRKPAERPPDFETFWSGYIRTRRFLDLKVDPQLCRSHLSDETSPRYRDIFAAVLFEFGKVAGKARVAEKTPGHVYYLPTLWEWFPEARVLLLQRDPRAVVASQLRSPWVARQLTPTSWRHGFLEGSRARQVAHYAHDWHTIHGQIAPRWWADERLKVVAYETLVADPEAELRAICDHLGEDYDPRMIERRGQDAPVSPARGDEASVDDPAWKAWEKDHLERAAKPINTDSLEKWKQQLTAREVAWIEGVCGNALPHAGYEPSCSAGSRQLGRVMATAVRGGRRMELHLRGLPNQARHRTQRLLNRVVPAAVARGVPARWFGYRRLAVDTPRQYVQQRGGQGAARLEVIHPPSTADHPLPRNVETRRELPGDAGWWGYSMRDVPTRPSGETALLTLRDATVVAYRDPQQADDYFPSILTHDGRTLAIREMTFRPGHAAALAHAGPPQRMDRATWVLERVYHNHSHWLTAHLPKLLVLRERDALGEVVLPTDEHLTPTLRGSLDLLGLKPDDFARFDPARPLRVGELTLVLNDRFRPQLLHMVNEAFTLETASPPSRRVYISRERAKRRKLVNEPEVWGCFERHGFEKVLMEDLDFEGQVRLMNQTAVLAGPHGAGLTNLLFMPRGGAVLEIADPGFANPNFYATASAMEHAYWWLRAESVGDGPPLEKDLRIEVEAVDRALVAVEAMRANRGPTGGGA